MKLLALFFIAIALTSSCNNADTEQQVAATDTLSQEKQLKDAFARYPDSTALLDNLIDYYDNTGNLDAALATVTNAIVKDSNNAALWDRKAILYIEKKDTINAIKAYENALNIFPDPEYIMTVGLLYAFTKDNKAIGMANALLIGKNAKAEKEAYIIKGVYLNAINEKQKAISFFDKALGLSYTYMPGYLQKAITLYEMAKYDEAVAVLQKAVTFQNSFDEGYYWLGKCYEKLNRREDAIENYNNALLYNKDYVEASDALAKLGIK
jgi:tetratricopeptide (TPR) repeat protein